MKAVNEAPWYVQTWEGFLTSLDLSETLRETTRALEEVPNGIISLIVAVPALVATYALFVVAYVMDFSTTAEAAAGFVEVARELLSWMAGISMLAWTLGVLGIVFTFFSTTIEMIGTKFSKFNLPSWRTIVVVSIIFDAVTDTVRVNQFLVPLWGPWTNNAEGLFGVLVGGPGVWFMALFWGVCWLLTLAASSYYVELLAISAAWAVIGLLIKSFGYWVLGALAGKGFIRWADATGGLGGTGSRGGARPQQSGARAGGGSDPRQGRPQRPPRPHREPDDDEI